MVAGVQMLVGQLRDVSKLDRLASITPFMLLFVVVSSVALAGVAGELQGSVNQLRHRRMPSILGISTGENSVSCTAGGGNAVSYSLVGSPIAKVFQVCLCAMVSELLP